MLDGVQPSNAVAKAEQRRQTREMFKSKYESLEARRPGEELRLLSCRHFILFCCLLLTWLCSYEDPRDATAIAYAEKNKGDFKLKEDPAYVVPEHLRVNAEKKLRQMILLEESIYTLKMVCILSPISFSLSLLTTHRLCRTSTSASWPCAISRNA